MEERKLTNAELITELRQRSEAKESELTFAWLYETQGALSKAADLIEAQQARIAEQQKQIARLYLLLNNKINEIAKLKAQLPGVSEWKNQYGDGNWHCSKCGAIVEKDEQERHYWQWCYHCGSKMRKG